MDSFRIINTDATNIGNFGMCGYKNKKHVGFQKKLDWTKARFAEGMKYKMLVKECIDDARKSNMKGVAVITRKGSWMAGEPLFEKLGFKVTDTAKPDFKLLALKFNLEACSPKFSGNWGQQLKNYGDGLTIITSDQCPYVIKSVTEILEVAEDEFKITPNIIHLESSSEARQVPCAFGIFCMINNGKVVAENPISKTRFRNIMKKLEVRS